MTRKGTNESFYILEATADKINKILDVKVLNYKNKSNVIKEAVDMFYSRIVKDGLIKK